MQDSTSRTATNGPPLKALEVLAKALDKPLLRRPRVVHCHEEALQLFSFAQQPAANDWVLEVQPEEEAEAMSPDLTISHRWTTHAIQLGILPCKEAVAAFMGVGGCHVQGLRRKVRADLVDKLRACKRGVRVWLDVDVTDVQPPACETGSVRLTAKARCELQKLCNALEQVEEEAKESVQFAIARAES